jgi:hypothetical protein
MEAFLGQGKCRPLNVELEMVEKSKDLGKYSLEWGPHVIAFHPGLM